ncbi:MAG: hypothetical protein DCF17_13110 [Shackletoniella antarctica]|jgi:hypothetical protein|uniref:Uncharacterized protein n=1 Tax=Shackletoniella antarctica TaxID=268115 RepID=A0A2W4XXX7_9CYAN|nr:MAG: hypothetical protein DCF17_13110 [Shackletoniella antarctica]
MTPEEIQAIAAEVVAQLKASEPDNINWGAVRMSDPSTPRPQCGKLDTPTWFKLQAIALKSYEGSMAGVIKTAVMCYVRQKWPNHCEDFRAIAAQHNLTLEECLEQVVSGELKI